MKAMLARHALYDCSRLEETELALAGSPCPQIEESTHCIGDTEVASKRGGPSCHSKARWQRHTAFRDDELTGTASMGLAISALAITGLLVVYFSGG